MSVTIGIRREDKNRWERRVPLTPSALAQLQRQLGLHCVVQPSPIRTYSDAAYREAQVKVSEDLTAADLIFAIKEVPIDLLLPGKVYVYFAHVIKGQPYNMPMLNQLLELGCTLVDYEKIVDEKGRRLIFFGRHAGYAGALEALWCLGRRWGSRGVPSPLAQIRHAYEYVSLADAEDHLRELGRRTLQEGLPDPLRPLVIGVAGYGNVAQGCQQVLSWLPVAEVPVAELPVAAAKAKQPRAPFLTVVFKEEDMVEPIRPATRFELQDYYRNPQNYRGVFERHLGQLDVLLNTIYWDERYPRLVTKDWARRSWSGGREARLQVIGDISCDIEGSIEPTLRSTQPDSPCFVYDPVQDDIRMGWEGHGPVIMAVDNLPCELPRESSEHFSASLRDLVPSLAACDWSVDFAQLDLPPHLKGAVVCHKGALTPPFQYLQGFLET